MKWPGPLIEATFLKRYKRFLADFRLPDGSLVTAHCANTGSMEACQKPEARGWLTHHDDPKRKLKYTWQAIEMDDGWVGINTSLANHLVKEAVVSGVVPELAGYAEVQTEKKYGKNSRIDLLLQDPVKGPCYVEVKNVTLLLEDGVAAFPDAVTQRGTKHIEELCSVMDEGGRAVLFFCVQRTSARKVVPAEAHDPIYAAALRDAVKRGLEVYAYKAAMSPDAIALNEALPVVL